MKRRTRRSKKRGGATTNIKYGNVAVNGQEMTKGATVYAPSVSVPAGHFLIMWDPDAPAGTYLHWIQDANGPIISYKGPTPPSGTHRYIFRLVEGSPQVVPRRRAPIDVDAIIGGQVVKFEKQMTVSEDGSKK
jgi:hypothetical protein